MSTLFRIPEDRFGQIMKGVLSPSQAIQTPELLKGRDKKLDDIRRSLYQEGRQIFIHGYRGVGKTSLAQTAAIQYQSSEAQPILLGCTENGTFYQTIRDLYAAAFPSDPSISKKVEQGGAKAGVGGVSAERKQSIEKSKIAELSSVNEAVALTEYVATHHSKKPAVILDEFDLIKSPAEQALFASFVKQLADKRLNIRFFFCGIADSVEEFFGAHELTYRYFHTVKLDRLEFSPRIEIIDTAAKALDIVIDDYTTQRIARISDGFPHFIHLVGEKLFWIVYNDLGSHMKVSPDHFEGLFLPRSRISIHISAGRMKRRHGNILTKANQSFGLLQTPTSCSGEALISTSRTNASWDRSSNSRCRAIGTTTELTI